MRESSGPAGSMTAMSVGAPVGCVKSCRILTAYYTEEIGSDVALTAVSSLPSAGVATVPSGVIASWDPGVLTPIAESASHVPSCEPGASSIVTTSVGCLGSVPIV